jgi:hypothetical protein
MIDSAKRERATMRSARGMESASNMNLQVVVTHEAHIAPTDRAAMADVSPQVSTAAELSPTPSAAAKLRRFLLPRQMLSLREGGTSTPTSTGCY